MSRLAAAAYEWLLEHAPSRSVSTDELWAGLQVSRPELTAVGERRKTPRNTLMRDMRLDKAGRFRVADRQVTLLHAAEPNVPHRARR